MPRFALSNGSILPPFQHLVVSLLDVCAFPLRARRGGRISYQQVAFHHRHLLRVDLSGLLPLIPYKRHIYIILICLCLRVNVGSTSQPVDKLSDN